MSQGPHPLDFLGDCIRPVFGFWTCLAFLLSFIAVMANHQQLLFDEPLRLGAIDLRIDRPFYYVFLLAPVMFVLIHSFLMVQIRLLTHRKALSAQTLVGAARERQPDWLLSAAAGITLALAPIGIILAIEVKFLPYHDHLATWTHRALLVIELAIAFGLFPLVFDAGWFFSSKKPMWRAARVTTWMSLSALCLLLAFPGEPHLDRLKKLLGRGNSSFCETILPVSGRLEVYVSHYDLQVFLAHHEGTPPNFRKRDLRCSEFGNSVLQDVDFSDANLSEANFESANLTKANFNNADLTGADLNKANLGDARFINAILERTILTNADFKRADLKGAKLKGAQLAGAQFLGADLSGADFGGADLREPNLAGGVKLAKTNLERAPLMLTQLVGADLSDTILREADLRGANLRKSNLTGAQLERANLFEARLEDATLQGTTNLQGANLFRADLERAKLDGAKLLGAVLSLAVLGGADLRGADLRGADLRGADLRGAKLQGANLSGADLRGVKLQGANLSGADLSVADLGSADLTDADLSDANLRGADLSKAGLANANLVRATLEFAGVFGAKLSGTKVSDCSKAYVKDSQFTATGARETRETRESEMRWHRCENSSRRFRETEYRQQHANLVRELVCSSVPADKGEIAEAIVGNWVSDDPDRGEFSSFLVRSLLGLDGQTCAVGSLSEQTQKRLHERARTTSSAN